LEIQVPDIAWNKKYWHTDYSWPESGEEWSVPWGGSEAQWFGALYPRLHRFLPARRVLEIAPGHGRWTKFLVPACSEFLGIDLAARCVDVCKRRFEGSPHAAFAVNDGLSLDLATDGQFDLVFSFDSLVHAEIDVFESYVPQILRKLSPRGVAFLHHSNLAEADLLPGQPCHGRGKTMSGGAIAKIIAGSGGSVIVQEVIAWVKSGLIDCLTLFGRVESFGGIRPVWLKNPSFMVETSLIKTYQQPYSTVPLETKAPNKGRPETEGKKGQEITDKKIDEGG
jgi:SAM-dependent methyltransferase